MNELKMSYDVPMRPTMTHTIVFSLLLLLLSVCPVWSQTYYVKSGGNDSAAGTSDGTAWATIAKVTATATSGDTVYFRSQDTWTNDSVPLVLNAAAGVTYIGNGYGSGTRATFYAGHDFIVGSSYFVVLISRNNVTFRGFDIDLNTKRALNGIHVAIWYGANVSNVSIDNVIVRNGTGIQWTDWCYGIYLGSTLANRTISNISVTNSTVYNVFHEGIAVYQEWHSANTKTDNVLLSNNTLYGNMYGILVANDVNNITVENNNIYNNSLGGIFIRVSPPSEGPGNVAAAPRNMIFRNNYIHENPLFGVEIIDPRIMDMSGDFYNNIFYNNGSGTGSSDGADIIGRVMNTGPNDDTHYTFSAGSVFNFYNNSFYNNVNNTTTASRSGVFIWCGDGDWCQTHTLNFKNNIIHTGPAITQSAMKPILDKGGFMVHSNNLVYRANSATAPHVVVGSTNYDRNGGASDITMWESTAKKTDPLFVSASTHDFRLQAGSPAINAGVNVGLTTDYLGNAIAGLPDIGAYEFQLFYEQLILPAPQKVPVPPTGVIVQ